LFVDSGSPVSLKISGKESTLEKKCRRRPVCWWMRDTCVVVECEWMRSKANDGTDSESFTSLMIRKAASPTPEKARRAHLSSIELEVSFSRSSIRKSATEFVSWSRSHSFPRLILERNSGLPEGVRFRLEKGKRKSKRKRGATTD